MTNKKVADGTATTKTTQPNCNTRNLFGLSRNQWERILDNIECVLILGGFCTLTIISLLLAMFGRCL